MVVKTKSKCVQLQADIEGGLEASTSMMTGDCQESLIPFPSRIFHDLPPCSMVL